MIDKDQWREFGQDTGVTPLLFTRSAMGFLMTTESQDLGLTSHLKDGIIKAYKWYMHLIYSPLSLWIAYSFSEKLNPLVGQNVQCD